MKYRIHMSQVGHGKLTAVVEVEADNIEDAQELAYEQNIQWKVAKFSGEGYDIDEVELVFP